MAAAQERHGSGWTSARRTTGCASLDADGKRLLSVKVANDETEILALIATVERLAEQAMWAVDIIGAPSALMLALLAQADQSVRYASGRMVAAMSSAYAGEGKTDAKDAYVIAETARLRRDLAVVDRDTRPGPQPGDADRPSGGSGRRPGADDQPAARPDDQRVPRLGKSVRLRLPQGCARAADRICQPRPDPPHRPDPSGRMAAPAQGAATPPASPLEPSLRPMPR